MDELNQWLGQFWGFFTTAAFQIGTVSISVSHVVGFLVVVLSCWLGASLVEHAIVRVLTHRFAMPGDQSAGYAIGRLSRYATWIVGGFIGLQLVGFNLSNLAIIGGALGIGIGFGLQNIVGNFVSGIILLVERSLKVGDFVDLASGVRGTITEIGVRFTRVTTNSNVDVIVPNSEFTNARVTNWTLDNQYRRINVPFSVAYGSDKQLVLEAALSAANAITHTVEHEGRKSKLWFTKFGDSALEFELVVWIGPGAVNRPGSVLSDYLWAIDDALRERGIEVPFPQRDLHLRSGRLEIAADKSLQVVRD
ncbi:MAG: mechanosensitive ion channel family protein [Steroidobacteraceae bacterium]